MKAKVYGAEDLKYKSVCFILSFNRLNQSESRNYILQIIFILRIKLVVPSSFSQERNILMRDITALLFSETSQKHVAARNL